MRYVENVRTGEVHEETCGRVRVIAQRVEYDPAKAHLLLGRRACWVCLPQGLPEAPREPWLLEDPDGAAYPEEVQSLVEMFAINPGTAGHEALVAALESVAWHAWRDGLRACWGRVTLMENPHATPKGE